MTRPWVPCVVMAMLVGLVVAAYLARGASQASMSISPASVVPGQSITVRFAEPQVTDDRLTFQAGSKLFVLHNDTWVEVDAHEGERWWSIVAIRPPRTSFTVTLPNKVEPGRYTVCVSGYGESQPTQSSEDVADLLGDEAQPLCAQLDVRGG